jgi:hypothetical protein
MHAALFLGAAVITMTLGRFDRELQGEDGPLLRAAYRREIERAVDRVKGPTEDQVVSAGVVSRRGESACRKTAASFAKGKKTEQAKRRLEVEEMESVEAMNNEQLAAVVVELLQKNQEVRRAVLRVVVSCPNIMTEW